MKEKWLRLTWPQRVVLLLQGFLILLFLILYCTLGRQQTIQYRGEHLRRSTAGEITTYSGKLHGQTAVFTVSPGPVVEFALDGEQYGPYSIVFDPTAVPAETDDLWGGTTHLTGVEVRDGETLLFRGAYRNWSSAFYLVNEDGEVFFGDDKSLVTVQTGSGITATYKSDSTPGPYSILKIALAPDVTSRGDFGLFFLGLLCCLFCALFLWFADRLFRWNLRFLIRNVEDAEPSDWELFSRWVGWVVLTIAALAFFITGLSA